MLAENEIEFSEDVIKHLKYYVYRLIDPRNGETFYIGKGSANRVFDHAKGEIVADEDELSDKLKRILDIRKSGFNVAHVIHRHGLDEKTAFEVESALIDAYPEVTNIVKGHDGERGVMHSNQIIEQYKAPEITFQHKLLMININQTANEANNLYEAVRYAWKLNPEKAIKADFVLAMERGVVIGVFVAEKWLATDSENFPGREWAGRYAFIGGEAPENIKQLYCRKRLPDSMRKRGAANPVKYSF